MLQHYVKDPRCQRVYFVGCHDSGYVHDLKSFIGGNPDEARVVLVETTPAHKDIKALNLPLIQFDKVFRSKPLPQAAGTASSPRMLQGAVTAVSPPAAPQVRVSGNGGVSVQHPPSYANAGGAGGEEGHQNLVIRTSPTSPIQPKSVVAMNKNGRRLDRPIKQPSMISAAQSSYIQKSGSVPGGFCNDHYLNGKCPKKQYCDREHTVKLSPDEVAIHRYKARMAVCFNGPKCDDPGCVHGHHCPQLFYCNKNKCRWRDTIYGDLHLNKDEVQSALG